jgi:hypothetical protein
MLSEKRWILGIGRESAREREERRRSKKVRG